MTLVEQIKSMALTAGRVLADRKLWVSEDTMQDRIRTCEVCPHMTFSVGRTKKPHCLKCGCGLLNKVIIHGSTCPESKW